jgi:GNAT superfamily N-acetyltransferase
VERPFEHRLLAGDDVEDRVLEDHPAILAGPRLAAGTLGAVDGLELEVVDAGSPAAQWALTQYFEELARRFRDGFEAGGGLQDAAATFREPYGRFIVACVAGRTVGCGGVQFVSEETAEIKRMWVSPDTRGHGVGKRLLARLEDEARLAGRSKTVLDTNGVLAEAIALYRASGYSPTARYNDNPYAELWFEKSVGGRAGAAGG